MICMIPKVNLGIGEIGFIFCDLYMFLLNNPMPGDTNLKNWTCLTCFARQHIRSLKF